MGVWSTPISRGGQEDGGAGRPATAGFVLSGRELEVLKLVAAGSTNREIARKLWVTEQTVKFHLSNIYRKLGVANRTEASHYAHTNGLVDGGESAARVVMAGPLDTAATHVKR